MKKILVAEGEKSELKKIFKTTYPTVRDALNGKRQTYITVRIREAALKRGGLEV